MDEGHSYNNRILAFSPAFTFSHLTTGCWRTLPGSPKAFQNPSYPQGVGAHIFFTEQWALLLLLTSPSSSRRQSIARFTCVFPLTLHTLSFEGLMLYFRGLGHEVKPQPPPAEQRAAPHSEYVIFFQNVLGVGSGRGLSPLVFCSGRV